MTRNTGYRYALQARAKERLKIILAMRKEGKTSKEIADFLGCPIGTVTSTLVRGKPGYEAVREQKELALKYAANPKRVEPLVHTLAPLPSLQMKLPWE